MFDVQVYSTGYWYETTTGAFSAKSVAFVSSAFIAAAASPSSTPSGRSAAAACSAAARNRGEFRRSVAFVLH